MPFITGLHPNSQAQTISLRIALAGPFAYAPPVGTITAWPPSSRRLAQRRSHFLGLDVVVQSSPFSKSKPAGSPPGGFSSCAPHPNRRRGISIKRGAAAFKIPSASELGGVVAVSRDNCLKQGAHDDTAVNKDRFGTKAPFTSLTV
jgi:hypothetical protein